MNGCLIEGMGCPGGCMGGARYEYPVKQGEDGIKEIQGKIYTEDSTI